LDYWFPGSFSEKLSEMKNLDNYSWMVILSDLSLVDLFKLRRVSKPWRELTEAQLKIRKHLKLSFVDSVLEYQLHPYQPIYPLQVNNCQVNKCELCTPSERRKIVEFIASMCPNLEDIFIEWIGNENTEFIIWQFKDSIKKLTLFQDF